MGERADWQPIETAPKDGTRILLGRFKPNTDHDGRIAVDWYRSRKANVGFIGFGEFNMNHWPPTHWMPLPARPLPGGDKP